MEEKKYDEELWGKVEFLHDRYKRKHLYVSNFIEIINKFQNACLSFSKSLMLIISKNYQLLEEKNNSIYTTIENLLSFINLQSQEYNELYINLKSNILEPTNKVLEELNHKEKELYSLYLKSRTQYHNSRSSLEKAQKEYENSIKMCEKAIFNSKSLEINPLASNEDKDKNINKTNTFINNSKSIEDKYFTCIEEANKMRTNEYNKQKELLEFYQKIDSDNYSKIKGMIGVFLVLIKKMYKSIFSSIETLSDQYKNINVAGDLNLFIEKNKSEDKPDKPIVFVPYCPEANLKTTSISGDQKENEKLQINYEVISMLRKSFRNICEDLNMEEETKKHRLRLLSLKIFKIGPNVTFSQEEKKELLSYLKIPEYRTYFIINLSKQRTKGRFQRGEKLLDDLADILEFILEISEKEKNYEDAKNCLILSQTFYTEITIDKNKKKEKYKRYLFDYIIDNKWLTSLSFWEGIIDFMIQKEIKKNEEVLKDQIAKETIEERRARISNIGFSQLLPYASNMLEFYMKKDIVRNLVELFVKKYDIVKNTANMIFDAIENTPEKPPIVPIVRKKKKIIERKIKKAKSLVGKKDYNLNIDFEYIDKKQKKITSVEKYKTKIKLEENKLKLKRKNELSKKFKNLNFNDEDDDSIKDNSLYSKKSSSLYDDSLDVIRKRSYEIENSLGTQPKKFNYTSTMSFDITDYNFNLNAQQSSEINSNISSFDLDEKNNKKNLNEKNNENENEKKNLIKDIEIKNNCDINIKVEEKENNIINKDNKIEENKIEDNKIEENKKINENNENNEIDDNKEYNINCNLNINEENKIIENNNKNKEDK